MIYKKISLYYLHLFPSLRLRGCVVVFIYEKENWQCFSRLLSRHSPPCFDHVLQCIPSGVHLILVKAT